MPEYQVTHACEDLGGCNSLSYHAHTQTPADMCSLRHAAGPPMLRTPHSSRTARMGQNSTARTAQWVLSTKHRSTRCRVQAAVGMLVTAQTNNR